MAENLILGVDGATSRVDQLLKHYDSRQISRDVLISQLVDLIPSENREALRHPVRLSLTRFEELPLPEKIEQVSKLTSHQVDQVEEILANLISNSEEFLDAHDDGNSHWISRAYECLCNSIKVAKAVSTHYVD